MEKTVTAEQMNALKALSETNLKVSEAKETLFKLQETETQYLVEREKRAVEKIQEAVEASAEMLSEISNNYKKVNHLGNLTSEFSAKLVSLHDDFHKMLLDYTEKNDAWEKGVNNQLAEISELRKNIKTDRIRLENDRKGIERREKLIADEKQVIESRQAQIKTALEVLSKKRV